jgi:putative ABC transport system permease protein
VELLAQDVRYAFRTFVRQPVFALTAIVALALGIGANTAVFSAVYAVLLKPLPFPDSDELIYVHDTYPAVRFASVSVPKYLALRDRSRTLDALGAMASAGLTLTGGGEPEQIPASRVSADFFRVLNVPALRGRWFDRSEDVPGGPKVIVLSHGLWQRRFGGDARIVGRAIPVNGEATTVVGVMPPDITYPGASQAWVPLAASPQAAPGSNFLRLIGRLREGVTVEQAAADMEAVSAAYNAEAGLTRGVLVWPLRRIMTLNSRTWLLVLQGAVVFVLLIACANVANLLLARSVWRQRELGIRAALGAGRGRIVRQLVTEGLMLAGVGAGGGVLLALWILRLFKTVAPATLPALASVSIDGSVLLFTSVVAILTGLLFGLAPARSAVRLDPHAALRDAGDRGSSGTGERGVSRAFVVAEIALALILLAGAGLMAKSLVNLQREDLGFEPRGLVTFDLSLPAARYAAGAIGPFYERAIAEIAAVPGVRAAGAISVMPLVQWGVNGPFAIEGRPPFPAGAAPITEYRVITPGYVEAMGVSLRAGEAFTARHTAVDRPVAIVNETMARQYWPGESPIGARIRLGFDPDSVTREIIGVVSAVRSSTVRAEPVPETYVPHAQVPSGSMSLAIRTSGDPGTVLAAIRRRMAAIDPDLPLIRVRSMPEVVAASAGESRFSSVMTIMFALLAALLAGLGVYSVVAYSVARRTREIGIRVALGADHRGVVRLVLGEGMRLAAVGVALGGLGALALTRTLRTMLHEVSPTDPAVLAATCAAVLALVALASYVPARRAARVDPLRALRAD